MKVKSLNSDRISSLPQDITGYILTCMPIRDAIRTSILSRKWRSGWKSMTKLAFDDKMVKVPSNCLQLKKYKLASAILNVLSMHTGSLLDIIIDVGELDVDSEFDQIIRSLSRNDHLQNLRFCASLKHCYKLPSSFFSLRAGLESIGLTHCLFRPPIAFDGFSKLRAVRFAYVYITSKALQLFLSTCPLLRYLALIDHSREFVEGNKLTLVELSQCVPLIEFLEIRGGMLYQLPTSLVQLKYLLLDVRVDDVYVASSALCLIRSSPNLKEISLSLSMGYMSDTAQISKNLPDIQDNPGFTLDHLRFFLMVDFSNEDLEVHFLKLIMAKSPMLKKAKILLNEDVSLEDEIEILRDTSSTAALFMQAIMALKEEICGMILRGIKTLSMDMLEFYDTVNNLEIEDICSSGFHYTWTKSLKNPNCAVLKKLDRIMVNEEFNKCHQRAHGVFHPYGISDHSPSVLIIHDGYKQKNKAFRFSNFTTGKAKFIETVKNVWEEEVQGCHMYKLTQKLKKLTKPLKQLSWNDGNVHDRVKTLKDELMKSQEAVDKVPFDEDARVKAAQVLNEYVEASKDELSESKPVQPIDEDLMFNKISEEDAALMIRDVTFDEIKDAIFDIDGNKASGPDRYSVEFFKKAWDIIGKDVCLAVKEFSRNGKILGEVNATLIDLIPKIATPSKVSEFRPKACCNIIYKCIRKILTSRIKQGLSKIMNVNQSAFIPRRHIHDIILLAQELMRGYNRRNGPKRCAMQIDIQKAYDTVSWRYLENVLIKFAFPVKMVNWIMACISSSAFFICLNGKVYGYFKGRRGLRQGDPISPYLFTLVIEVFNVIMSKNINESKDYGFHFGCKELQLSHLCFADDLLVLCKGNRDSLEVVKKSLKEFSLVSGLNPNMVRYLGVPMLAKRLSVLDCKVLTDKVEERIKCWRNKPLSYAGRIQLLAYVLSPMQIYWASVYLLPNSVVKDLDKLFKRPKDQGGLGIKPLRLWNEVLLIRQFWKIIENKDSPWAKWVNVVRLKRKRVWDVQTDKCDSWGWKTMLRIRDLVKDHVCQLIPRHAFILWLAIQGKLMTQDRMEKWQNNVDLKCALCKSCADLHEHLFFKCAYTLKVWKEMLKKTNNLQNKNQLMKVVDIISKARNRNSIRMVIKKLVLAATVYFLWQERNQRLFRNEIRTEEVICKVISEQVRHQLISLRVKKSTNVIKEATKWNLQWSNMSFIAN
nr:hypothetical protein [Tanacetum cinerariifolium]